MGKKSAKKSADIEVPISHEFANADCFVFSHYSLRADDDFLWLLLGHAGPESVELLFKGAMCIQDARLSIASFKDYITRIGTPSKPVEGVKLAENAWASRAPTSFNSIGVATHGRSFAWERRPRSQPPCEVATIRFATSGSIRRK